MFAAKPVSAEQVHRAVSKSKDVGPPQPSGEKQIPAVSIEFLFRQLNYTLLVKSTPLYEMFLHVTRECITDFANVPQNSVDVSCVKGSVFVTGTINRFFSPAPRDLETKVRR